jgi:DNA (cytosine-5)-methyltransferase 1
VPLKSAYEHLDLFSGIGGFALAARWNGLRTIQFVEYEPYAQKVLRKNFPDVPIHDDIKDFNATKFRKPFLCTGGYPCQPFSQSGLRRGEKDHRHLWPEMLRVIQECRPTWVLAENVAGHITMGLDQVLSDLEGEDYACQPFVIPACAKDARHRRDRVWIVGWDSKSSANNQIRKIQKRQDSDTRRICERSISKSGKSGSKKTLGHADGAGCKERRRTKSVQSEFIASEHGSKDVVDSDDVRHLRRNRSMEEIEGENNDRGSKEDGSKEWWLAEPDVGRVAHGVPNRVDRLRGLGNAIVPQVASEIIRAIVRSS